MEHSLTMETDEIKVSIGNVVGMTKCFDRGDMPICQLMLHIRKATRAFVARFPDSEVGRRVLRILNDRRREAQIRQLRADAEEAVARGEITLALALFGQALAAGPRGDQLAPIQARIEAINVALRERAEQAEVERTVALLNRS